MWRGNMCTWKEMIRRNASSAARHHLTLRKPATTFRHSAEDNCFLKRMETRLSDIYSKIFSIFSGVALSFSNKNLINENCVHSLACYQFDSVTDYDTNQNSSGPQITNQLIFNTLASIHNFRVRKGNEKKKKLEKIFRANCDAPETLWFVKRLSSRLKILFYHLRFEI